MQNKQLDSMQKLKSGSLYLSDSIEEQGNECLLCLFYVQKPLLHNKVLLNRHVHCVNTEIGMRIHKHVRP